MWVALMCLKGSVKFELPYNTLLPIVLVEQDIEQEIIATNTSDVRIKHNLHTTYIKPSLPVISLTVLKILSFSESRRGML